MTAGWKTTDTARPRIGLVHITGVSMKKAGILFCICMAALTQSCGLFGPRQGLVIARNGKSEYRIIVADDASRSTLHGAVELQAFLNRMTGAELPIVTDSLPMREHEIILGNNEHLRKLDTGIDFDGLGDEGYVLKTIGDHLVIAGGSMRGTMYGVYGLLEDHLGCRWFTPEVSKIPSNRKLVVPELDETVLPVLEYREPFVYECFDGDWAARNRMNGSRADVGDRRGGRVEWGRGMFVHTFNYLVPPDEHFDAHPEYFSLVDGKRLKHPSQLCCTNENVIKLVTERMLEEMRKNPQATVFSLSQNDWFNFCQCKKCRAAAEREGSQIAPVLMMVNRVAEEAEKEFPDKIIETLAYQWTRHPPKTLRPRHNVVVRLCSIECCFSHPLGTCDSPQNTTFTSDLREWSKICDRLWVWNYCTSFSDYLLPFPNLRVRDDNIRLFVENNVTGVFQQDVYTTPHGELSSLSGYLNAKLLWNPDYDEDTAINEFLAGVYGGAAGPIRAYIDMLHDKVASDNIHMPIWPGQQPAYLTAEILDRADMLWDEAEVAVAGNPDVLERVKIARLSVDYGRIQHDRLERAYIIDRENLRVEVDPSFAERVERFCELADQSGVLMLSEGGLKIADFRDDVLGSLTPRTLTPNEAVDPGNVVEGLTVRYYNGGWEISKLKPSKTLAVEQFLLPDNSEGKVFGAVYEGFLSVPDDGVYTFYTRSDDGTSLYIGDELVVDNGGHHAAQDRFGFAVLKAGLHPIKLTYYNSAGGAALDVFYRSPGGEKEQIPASALRRKKR